MTIFASKNPRDLNHDPEYLVHVRSGGRGNHVSIGEDANLLDWEHDPRPQFDAVLHHPASPILPLFRQLHGAKRGADLSFAAAAWLASLRDMSIACAWPEDATEHARKVLRRIARHNDTIRETDLVP